MFVEFSLNFPRLALDLVAVDLALVAILPLGIVVVFVLGRAARAGRARSSCPELARACGAARGGRAQTTCPARAGGAPRAGRARTTRARNAARAQLSGGAARAGRAALVVVSLGSVPQGIFSTFVPVGLQACPGVAVRVVVVLVSYILRRIQSALDRDVALLDLVCVALRSVC